MQCKRCRQCLNTNRNKQSRVGKTLRDMRVPPARKVQSENTLNTLSEYECHERQL